MFGRILSVACLLLVFAVSTAQAGPFGLFGGSSCSSGSCGNSYSAEESVRPDLAATLPHGIGWTVSEERAVRRESPTIYARAAVPVASSNSLVIAFNQDITNGRRIQTRHVFASAGYQLASMHR